MSASSLCVVTGATSGIGEGIALRFAAGGYHVVVNGRDKVKADNVVDEIASAGGSAEAVAMDISTEDGVADLFSQIQSQLPLKVLVNSAGVAAEAVFDVEAAEDPIPTYAINVFSPYWCSIYAARRMQSGSIINLSSGHAQTTKGARIPLYASSKAAVSHLSKQLAVKLAPNIRVNAISPGRVKTPIWDDLTAERSKRLAEGQLIKRWITVEEVADAAWFLAHNEAVTGTDLIIDGGLASGKGE